MKEAAVRGGGVEGDHGEGLSGLCRSFGNVTGFKYLGQEMTAGDDSWPEVVGDLQRARKSCGRLSRILIRERADPKVLGHF